MLTLVTKKLRIVFFLVKFRLRISLKEVNLNFPWVLFYFFFKRFFLIDFLLFLFVVYVIVIIYFRVAFFWFLNFLDN
jgi:hypothetical protein